MSGRTACFYPEYLIEVQRIHEQLASFWSPASIDPVNIVGEEADIRNFFCTFYETDSTPHCISASCGPAGNGNRQDVWQK